MVVLVRVRPRADDLFLEGSHNITTNCCHNRNRQLIVRHLTTSDYRHFGALNSKMKLALHHTSTTMMASLPMMDRTRNQKISPRETMEGINRAQKMKKLQKKAMD